MTLREKNLISSQVYKNKSRKPTDCLDGALSTLDWLDIEGVRCSLGGNERD